MDDLAEYVDTVTGSGKKDREEFARMMLAASQRQFDLFGCSGLFLKLDRLSREGRSRYVKVVRTPGFVSHSQASQVKLGGYTKGLLKDYPKE